MGHLLGPRNDFWRGPSSWTTLHRPQSGALTEAGARHWALPAGAIHHRRRGRGEWSLTGPPSERVQKVDCMEGMSGPHTWLMVGAGENPRDKWLPGACSEDKGLFWSPSSKEQSPGHQKWLFSTTGPQMHLLEGILATWRPNVPLPGL